MTNSSPRLVHDGFDTVEVAFQGFVLPSVRRVLTLMKDRAKERGEAVLALLGDAGLEAHVFGTGLGTGNHTYTWRLQSASGLIWAWNDNDDIEQWNGRVKAGAELCLTHTIEELEALIYRELRQLAVVKAHSISRVDYCMDFVAPEFKPRIERVSCHWKLRGDKHAPDVRELANGNNVMVRYSGRDQNSIRLGKQGRMQIACYNKRKEVIEQGKDFWFDVWKLDKDDAKSVVWRVELRAGRAILRDTWQLNTFGDLKAKAGDVFALMMQRVKLIAEDCADTNATRARVDPLWKAAREVIAGGLNRGRRAVSPERIQYVVRERRERSAINSMIGGAITWLSLQGISPDDLRDTLRTVSGNIRVMVEEKISRDPDRYVNALAARLERSRFVAPPKCSICKGGWTTAEAFHA